MTKPESPLVNQENYLLIVSGLLDLIEGGQIELIARHDQELGDMLSRVTVDANKNAVLTPPGRVLGLEELRALVLPARVIFEIHYKG